MTSKEMEALKEVSELVRNLRDSFSKVQERVKECEEKVEKKHIPITFESNILSTVQCAMNDSIKSVLTNYNSPFNKLVASVVDSHSTELRSIINDSFTKVIQTEDFKESIVSAFSHKVARSIISNNTGLFDKVSNELKQDATFKAKLAIAVSNVVEECLKTKDR
jgi:hypothetical protein